MKGANPNYWTTGTIQHTGNWSDARPPWYKELRSGKRTQDQGPQLQTDQGIRDPFAGQSQHALSHAYTIWSLDNVGRDNIQTNGGMDIDSETWGQSQLGRPEVWPPMRKLPFWRCTTAGSKGTQCPGMIFSGSLEPNQDNQRPHRALG